jgi:hypothetical protein
MIQVARGYAKLEVARTKACVIAICKMQLLVSVTYLKKRSFRTSVRGHFSFSSLEFSHRQKLVESMPLLP